MQRASRPTRRTHERRVRSIATTVRQQPLTATLSPIATSSSAVPPVSTAMRSAVAARRRPTSIRPTACTMPVNISAPSRSPTAHAARDRVRRSAPHARRTIVADANVAYAIARARGSARVDTRAMPRAGSPSTAGARYSRISSTSPASSSAPLSLRARLDVELVEPRDARARASAPADRRGRWRPEARANSTSAGHAALRAPAVTSSAPPPAARARSRGVSRVAVDDDAQRLARRRDGAHGELRDRPAARCRCRSGSRRRARARRGRRRAPPRR